ncbi:MAG: DNA starvation/stationary phase protection protein Dps [Chloroflexi bacterium]|nr:DNA starvation/stationary phase protection protein Dps [Chloroflexota bacterium]
MVTQTKAQTTFETHNDLPAAARQTIIQLLNQQLADTFDLYTQTKQAHWNVRGIHFYHLHKLFDDLAAAIEPFIDEIAERAGALGGLAHGTARMAADASRLPEYGLDIVTGDQALAALIERWSLLATSTRATIDTVIEECKDQDTGDLLIGQSRVLDKSLWFLEAHVQG